MRTPLRDNAWLLVLTAAGTAAGIGVGAASGRQNWPIYMVVIVLGGAVAIGLHVRHGFTVATRIGLAVFAVMHVAGGMLLIGDDVLYRWWLIDPYLRYDNIQHAWGFGFVGLATWEILGHRIGPAAEAPSIRWWVVVLGAVAAGSLNEIVEWILTLTVPGTDVGGYDNTARDLVANLAGGMTVGSWAAHRAP